MKEIELEKHFEQLEKRISELGPLPRISRLRTRPRDKREVEILALLDYKRVKKAMQDGILEKIGPREYRYNG